MPLAFRSCLAPLHELFWLPFCGLRPIQSKTVHSLFQCCTPLEAALEGKVVEVSTVKYDPGAAGLAPRTRTQVPYGLIWCASAKACHSKSVGFCSWIL
ncbi:uncharacterized protein FOBCDRAFT_219934 [Fusarium oxysporum Fo47]|uniref:uncharacterized protein n=1 Tax=Fusarium oxysporum Fo47 TaxID=660027 RepID=UPI002869C8C6|nr:uncharacterized protein FOBCDRAFT_219934 [Fusarium oxysporum Fo47]WJG35131.1 hypothetical protein FOBCDRAFT_219934 [Fusarium oxysporum Fo47]